MNKIVKKMETKKNKSVNNASADSIGQKFLNEFQQRYNKHAAEHNRKKVDVTVGRNVGNNGYNLGQQYTLTGAIEVVPIMDNDDPTKEIGCYLGLPTEEGPKLSLAALMGVSSLRGYKLEGTFKDSHDVEFTAETTDAAKKPSFRCWDLKDRNIYALAKRIKEDGEYVKGKKVTFHGIALRMIVRKTDTTDFNNVEWKVGDTSIIAQKLWSVA